MIVEAAGFEALDVGDFQIYLPLIYKPSLRFGPDGTGLLEALVVPGLGSANRDEVVIQVSLTPPNPTITPGANTSTPVPTPLPGSPTFTPTPKITLTPTATPSATPQLISNGDFEDVIHTRANGLRVIGEAVLKIGRDGQVSRVTDMPAVLQQ